MKTFLTIGTTLIACFLAAYFLWTSAPDEIAENHDHPQQDFLSFSEELINANQIGIEKASSGPIKKIIRAPAQMIILSDQMAHILPRASGIVLAAYKNLGEDVAAGEVIATLESKDMAEAKANYLTALRREQLASKTFECEKNLHAKNLSSFQDFNQTESVKEEALIELELYRQKLHTLGLNNQAIIQLPYEASDALRIYELCSPIAGKVIARAITPGELLTINHEAYIIANLSTIWAEIHVFSQDRQFVKQGQIVTIKTNDGQTIQTKVSFLSPIIDEDTRTSIALAKIENPLGAWLPGSFAQAEFIAEQVNAPLIVKKDAIQTIDGIDVLFVSQANGFAIRPVTRGRYDEENCEIISGLEPGEDYACKNTFLLKADLKKDEAEHMD